MTIHRRVLRDNRYARRWTPCPQRGAEQCSSETVVEVHFEVRPIFRPYLGRAEKSAARREIQAHSHRAPRSGTRPPPAHARRILSFLVYSAPWQAMLRQATSTKTPPLFSCRSTPISPSVNEVESQQSHTTALKQRLDQYTYHTVSFWQKQRTH